MQSYKQSPSYTSQVPTMNRNKPNAGGGGFSNVNHFQGGRQTPNMPTGFNGQVQSAFNPAKGQSNNGQVFVKNNNRFSNKGSANGFNSGNQHSARNNQSVGQGGRSNRNARGPSKPSGRGTDSSGISMDNAAADDASNGSRLKNNGGNQKSNTPRQPNKGNIRASRKTQSTQPSSKALPNQPQGSSGQNKPLSTISAGSNMNIMDTSNFEVKYFGTLLNSPESHGFQKINHKAQRVPRYMLQKNVLFDMSTYQPNEWDIENQQMLLRREAQYSGEPQLLFEEFQQHRQKEREKMESLNLVDKENAKKSLDDAIIFRGTCEDMCPTYERVERVFKNQVSKWEKDLSTGKMSRNYAMKTFIRPSGQAPSLPSDVRRPDVLQKSLSYLIENLLPKLPESQSFIWDRTRSIRQDFTFQNNYSGIESIDCHEKICRIHIMSLHVMSGANDPDYQQQQEVEQFNNSLQTLTHMYDDVRSRGGFCPNEPEFRAYELISKMKDSELDRYIQTLPDYIQDDPIVQRAIMLRSLVMEGMNSVDMYVAFFRTVLDKTKTSFLLASLAEIHFNEIRYFSLRSLGRVYHAKSKKMPTTHEIVDWLGFNDVDQLLATCKIYQLPVIEDAEMGVARIDVTAMKSTYKVTQRQAYTKAIDDMIGGRSMSQIVNSGLENATLNLKTAQSLEEIARESFKAGKDNSERVNKIFNNVSSMLSLNMNAPRSDTIPQVATSGMNATPSFPPAFGQGSSVANSFPVQTQTTIGTSDNNGTANTTWNAPLNSNLNGANITATQPSAGILGVPATNNSPGSEGTISSSSKLSALSVPVQLQNTVVEAAKPGMGSSPDVVNGKEKVKSFASGTPSMQHKEDVSKLTPSPPPKKKLVENMQFKSQAMRIVQDMSVKAAVKLSNEIIRCELDRTVAERKLKARQKTVESLSGALLEAFMNERLYIIAMEARAIALRQRNLKRFAIKGIVATASSALKRRKFREDKLHEIKQFNSARNTLPLLQVPVQHTKQATAPTKLCKLSENHIGDAFEKANPNADLCGTIITRSVTSVPSEWLLNQFGMSEENKNTRLKSASGRALSISVLPDTFDANTYFKNIGTAIIQVGTIAGVDKPDKATFINCLKKDALVIRKVKEYMERFSLSTNFSIVIVFVDSFHHGISTSDIFKALKLKEISTSKFTVGMFKLNMSSLLGGGTLKSLRKLVTNFAKIIETVWHKMYMRRISLMESSDSINVVADTTNLTRRSSMISLPNSSAGISHSDILKQDDSKLMPSSLLIKRKISYLNSILDGSNMKKRKFSTGDGHSSSFALSGSRSSSILGSVNLSDAGDRLDTVNDSLMTLRNYTDINNPTLTPVVSIDNETKKKLEELSELDELADSILKE